MTKKNEIKEPFLKIKNIKKSFSHVKALDDVSLEVFQGEVLAIVGDNGAGKSTLIKIISGVIKPDNGEIYVLNKKCENLNPKKALSLGISTVYQDLALADTRDVASNIYLGNELLKGCFLNKSRMYKESEVLIKNLGIKLPSVYVPVGLLSGGQKQGVAVARTLYNGGELIIFDEPTAAMGISESTNVLKLIRSLAQKGYGVIIISHNIPQVFDISDKICVMRHGKIAGILETEKTNIDEVISMITGAVKVDQKEM